MIDVAVATGAHARVAHCPRPGISARRLEREAVASGENLPAARAFSPWLSDFLRAGVSNEDREPRLRGHGTGVRHRGVPPTRENSAHRPAGRPERLADRARAAGSCADSGPTRLRPSHAGKNRACGWPVLAIAPPPPSAPGSDRRARTRSARRKRAGAGLLAVRSAAARLGSGAEHGVGAIAGPERAWKRQQTALARVRTPPAAARAPHDPRASLRTCVGLHAAGPATTSIARPLRAC
jgi:hypothetical protein